jgi:hypothetical protein
MLLVSKGLKPGDEREPEMSAGSIEAGLPPAAMV